MKVVIFCGGYGTRMWPASRKSFPKQFYPLIKGRSFFQLTYQRFRKALKPEDIYISTEERYLKFVKNQAPEIPRQNIVGEPERRDNLGAIGLVTAILEKRFPGQVMMAAWSDHIMAKESEFLRAVLAAGEYAKVHEGIVSVDSEPDYPTIHQGWIKLGRSVDEFKGYRIVQVERQLEKPDEETAKRYFKSGAYLLNMGYLAWRTDVMLSYYKKYRPEVYRGLIKITSQLNGRYYKTILFREYHKFKKESIDYGIFEKLPPGKRVTIPVKVGWEDAGTWELFYRAVRTKEDENVIEGGIETELVDSKGNLIIGPEGKIIATIGVENLVVIDTPDALLICKMDQTNKVKEVFTTLEKEKPKFVE